MFSLNPIGEEVAQAPIGANLCVRACVRAQSCLTLCDPTDCSTPGSSVHGISQARILEWLPFPSPGDLPDPGIEPRSPALAGGFLIPAPPGKALIHVQ